MKARGADSRRMRRGRAGGPVPIDCLTHSGGSPLAEAMQMVY